MNITITPAGRHEALLTVARILRIMKAAGESRSPTPRKSREQRAREQAEREQRLAMRLMREWRRRYVPALKELLKAIPRSVADAPNGAVDFITAGLADALGPSFGNSDTVRRYLGDAIKEAYIDAQREWSMKSPWELPDQRAVDVLTRHNCYWLGEHYENHVRGRIAELTQTAINEGVGRGILAERLRDALAGNAEQGYRYWDVVASSALVRSRSFGSIRGMEEAGITEYEILAMGDERMCGICGDMHGRTFSVADTRKVIDRALDIADPEAFKAAMPWHRKPPTGRSSADLCAAGMSLPPFHGRCRCVLVMVGAAENAPAPEPEPPQLVSNDEFEKLPEIMRLNNRQAKYDRISTAIKRKYKIFRNIDGTHQLNAPNAPKAFETIRKLEAAIEKMPDNIRRQYAARTITGQRLAGKLTGIGNERDRNDVIWAFKDAPEPILKMFDAYGGKLKVRTSSYVDPKGYAAGHYIPNVGIEYNRTKTGWLGVIRHEAGHFFDDMLGGGAKTIWYAHTIWSKAAYETAAQKDFTAFNKPDIIKQIVDELKSSRFAHKQYITDLIDNIASGEIADLPGGHGYDYYHSEKWPKHYRFSEMHANMTEIFGSGHIGDDEIKFMEQYMPELLKVYKAKIGL